MEGGQVGEKNVEFFLSCSYAHGADELRRMIVKRLTVVAPTSATSILAANSNLAPQYDWVKIAERNINSTEYWKYAMTPNSTPPVRAAPGQKPTLTALIDSYLEQSERQVEERPSNYKSVICRRWEAGVCQFGDR